MSRLPDGWAQTSLDQVARWGSGGTPSRSNLSYYGGGIPWIKTGELGPRFVVSTEETLSEQGLTSSSAKLFPKGAVAIAMYGATIGKTSILGIEASTNQACAVAIPDVRLTSSEYLYHYLCSQREAFVDAGKGGAQPNISQGLIREWPFPLAPLPEQKRIADKLDALLARVDACRARLDRVPGILKRFRQSVLAAATSGELTREWRQERGIDGEWPVVNLESVASDFSYGSAAKSSQAGKVPVLRMGNIQDGLLDWGDLVYTSDPAEIAKYKLTSGDVLFNRTNSPELVGKTAVFRGERDAIYAGYLIRVRCGERLLPDYLNYCLGSPAGREYCWQVKSDGVSQSNINARKLAAFTFSLPSVDEQREVVRRVEELLALNATLGTKSRFAATLVERLTPSTLAKAFRGELVPQDPNDEPADKLLAKLKAELSNAATEPTRRRPKTSEKRPTMNKVDKDAIKAVILKLKTDRFSFDELKANVAGDYESVKTSLFELLEEPSPIVQQIFDKKAKQMQLLRVRL